MLAAKVEDYVALRRSLGYAFQKQAATLHALARYAAEQQYCGPLTRDLALGFVLSRDLTPDGRARSYRVLCRFSEYLAIYEPQTEALDPRALPRSRATAPPCILSDEELVALLSASRGVSPRHPQRSLVLPTVIGLLASTGLRSGEALRLDREDVDLSSGILQVRETKFRKDRLVPVHATMLAALRTYARRRDEAFPAPKDRAFFLSSRGGRLSPSGLTTAFQASCRLAGLDRGRRLRPHDLRHRFAVMRLAAWHGEGADVQALLPLLAAYLGHARYSDTGYYVTAAAELLGIAARRAFPDGATP
jgi:integrase